MASGVGEFFSHKIADLPTWAWLGVIVVGGGVGYYFVTQQQKSSQAATSTTSTPGSSASTNSQNANPASAYSVGNQPVSADYSTNGQPTSPVYVISNPSTPMPTAPTTPTPTTMLTIRNRNQTTSGQFAQYDASHSGIPMRSGPGESNAVVAQVPFGAQVSEVGGPISGTANYQGSGSSTLWYQVSYNGQNGYVSIEDIIGSGGGGNVRRNVRRTGTTGG